MVNRARNGLPMTSAPRMVFSACIGVCQRQFSWIKNGVLVRRNAATIARASSRDAAIGFWQMHATRCFAQSSESGLCPPTSVMLSTKPGFTSRSSFSASS